MRNKYPLEYLTLRVNGEPYLAKNYTAIQQPWCENLTLNDILDKTGDFIKAEEYPMGQRPVFFMKFQPLKMPLGTLLHNLSMSVAGHVWSVLAILGPL